MKICAEKGFVLVFFIPGSKEKKEWMAFLLKKNREIARFLPHLLIISTLTSPALLPATQWAGAATTLGDTKAPVQDGEEEEVETPTSQGNSEEVLLLLLLLLLSPRCCVDAMPQEVLNESKEGDSLLLLSCCCCCCCCCCGKPPTASSSDCSSAADSSQQLDICRILIKFFFCPNVTGKGG